MIIYNLEGRILVDVPSNDLRWANLRGAYLSSADLRQADLTGADFYGANLRGANLGGANLRGARLGGANLREAYLRGANLRAAYLGAADLRRADLTGADLDGANLHRANLRDARLGGANLRGAVLRDARLDGALGLPDAPVVPNIDADILAELEAGGKLDMSSWHSCATTHCRAGWAVVLAGEAGRKLEEATSTYLAGYLIYKASRPDVPPPDFFATNEEAMKDLKRCAGRG